jgi:hemolysin activation/secretion protein
MDAPSGAALTQGGAVSVGAITITGLRELTPADFSDIITGRIGRTHTAGEFSSLANAIAERMRARGYAFASAWIEPQRLVNGILVVRADEGRIDEVRFDGAAPPSVRRVLEPLRTGEPVRIAEVERRLLLAGDIDGVRIRNTRFVREAERGVLLVRLTWDRVAARASLSNAGTRAIGPEQVRFDVDLNGLVDSDDSVTLSYATTPAQPRELQAGFIQYERRLNATGTEFGLAASLSQARPGSYLRPLDIRNRSWYGAASLLQPLLRRRKASAWLGGELGLRGVTQWRAGRRMRDDQLTTARLTVYGYGDVAGGTVRMSAALTQGLGILGATGEGDPLASRSDADGTFTAATLWAEWRRDLVGNLSLRLAAQGQLASQPLLIAEEIGLGGTVFLRGYDWGERSGDQGAMGSAELRYLWKDPLGAAKRAQLYAFLDGGTVSNRMDGFGGGALASAGGGMRVDMTSKLGASFEVAVPLTGDRYDTGDQTPKLNFAVTRAF